MSNLLPPIPQAPISETFQWRDWLRNLGNYISVAQVGGSPWTIVQGGTGSGTASGARANLGISVVGSTGAYADLTGKPTLGSMAAQNVGISVTITTAKLTVGGATGSMTFTNGILTAHTQAT